MAGRKRNIDGMGRAARPWAPTDYPAEWSKPPAEVAARVASSLKRGESLFAIGKPNLAHMHALLNAAESGAANWRRHPISRDELEAAYRATGRKPKQEREPGRVEAGEDWEEDATYPVI